MKTTEMEKHDILELNLRDGRVHGNERLEILVLPHRMIVYFRNSEDTARDLVTKLESLGISLKVEFDSPCG